ncbi:MAG: hypothetical protein OXT71_21965 [Acidobacteriota bacterium]|nr:hypothetical protein [Acidobacteriota bacterium]
MNKPTSNPVGISENSRAWRGDRLVPLAALLILTIGFSTTWVSADRDHPARVSFMDGRAAYESSGDVDWSEVTLNLPLVSGDRIVAHPDSRIEVELGDGNFVRISGETDVFFTELSRKKTLLKIHQGDLILRVNDAGSVYLDMELATMRIRKKGLYRIQVNPDGTMRLVVHKGRAEVNSRHGKERVETGQELLLDARQVGIQALVRDLDDFELWSGRRDALLVSSRSTGYLGGVDYPGVHSLDRHGHWTHYGSHGHVWVPAVAVGWTPFRHGRWCFLAGGWTWVSYEPWGWLPYHYGRWIYYGPRSRWAWVPGGFNRWHAAHVDFYWGNGYVGWAPRGYYGRGRRGRGNTTVVVNNNIFRNWNPRDRSNGLTVVHGRDLGRGPGRTRVVASNAIVGRFREGLPRELQRPRGRGPNAVYSRSGVRSSRSASRTRDRLVGTGSRRSGVARSGSKGSVVRAPSRRSAVSRSDRSGPARSTVRQRSDSRRSGGSGVNVIRTPTRAPQTTRSTAPSRNLSRSAPGSGGSFTNRSNRQLSKPPVAAPDNVSKGSRGRTPSRPSFVTRPNRTGPTGTFSRQRPDSRERGRSGPSFSRTPNRTPQSSRPSSPSRSISRSSSGSRGSVTRRTPRNQSRPSVSRSRSTSQRTVSRPSVRSSPRSSSRPSVRSRPAPRSTPSYRAPSPPRSRPSGSQVRSAPRSSGSSNRSSGSRRSSRRQR